MHMKVLSGILLLAACVVFSGCATRTEERKEEIPQIIEVQPVEPQVVPQPKVSEPQKKTAEELEYERSTQRIGTGIVSADAFANDKAAIMSTIKELDVIMKERNYQKWLSYVTPDSVAYWTNPRNLAAVTGRLPVKGIKIQSIVDYFTFIFIPARLNKRVDEIRYISPVLARAVEVQDLQDIIYYTFEKVNNKWLIRLDTID